MQNPLYADLNENIDAIIQLGAIWAKSGAFKCDREEQGQAILSFCIASGITPLEYLATYHNLGGKPQKLALACLAQFRIKGGKHKWLAESDDQQKAILECSFEGNSTTVEFTMEDAKRQGLLKPGSAWFTAPSYMLRARCITTAIGMLAPEIVAGAESAPDGSTAGHAEAQLDLKGEAAEPDKEAPQKTDEQVESEMGLAPVQPKEPVKPKPAAKPKKAKRKSISVPAPGEDEGTGPIPPPPATIEPEGATAEEPPTPPEKETVEAEPDELSGEIVNEMGHIFSGHFLEVAIWMIREKWIPAPQDKLRTEAQAGAHLQATLPTLTKAKAMKVLAKKMAFMRAVETIEP